MSSVYSTQFASGRMPPINTLTDVYTVPAGHVAILRDVALSIGAGHVFDLYLASPPAAQFLFWQSPSSTDPLSFPSLTGRHVVLSAGSVITLNTTEPSAGFGYVISGYLLSS